MPRSLLLLPALLLLLLCPAAPRAAVSIGVTGATSGGSTTTSTSVAVSGRPSGSYAVEPHVFVGGGVTAGFGDVEYVEVAPMVGVHLTPRLAAGVSFLYRSRTDTRFDPDLKTEDYGGTLFGRWFSLPPLFLQAEYEYLDYEYVRADLSKARRDFHSALVGGGVAQTIGRNASLYAAILYNVTWDEQDSPYDTPWSYRAGVGFGF